MVALAELHAEIDLKELEFTLEEKTVDFDLNISQIHNFINWIELYHPFKRGNLTKSNSQQDGVENSTETGKNIMESYFCTYNGENKFEMENPESSDISKNCNCDSKVYIVFPLEYSHNSKGEINVAQFGDKTAKLSWYWKHNHSMVSVSRFYNSELVKNTQNGLYHSVSSGISWNDIAARIRSEGSRLDLTKQLNRNILAYIYSFPLKKKILLDLAIRNTCLETSLKSWAAEISKVGVSVYKNDFNFLQTSPKKDTETEEKPWSFSFMTKWQKEMFLRDGKLFYLECTDIACQMSQKEQKVFLYTILVGSRKSCRGCPVAFMVTNFEKEEIIAFFLKMVKDFSLAEPLQALINIGSEQVNALKSVWPKMKVTTCRWFISRKFQEYAAKEDVSMAERDKSYEIERAQDEFLRILPVLLGTQEKTELKHDFRLFERQAGLSQKNQVDDAYEDVNHMGEMSSHHDLVVSFHTTLKLRFFNACVGERPDFLVYYLFKRVEPMYHVEELLVTRGNFPDNNMERQVEEKKKASKLSKEEVLRSVIKNGKRNYFVKSFTMPNERYSVIDFDGNGSKWTCSCPLWIETQTMCKHFFLFQRWFLLSKQYLINGDYGGDDDGFAESFNTTQPVSKQGVSVSNTPPHEIPSKTSFTSVPTQIHSKKSLNSTGNTPYVNCSCCIPKGAAPPNSIPQQNPANFLNYKAQQNRMAPQNFIPQQNHNPAPNYVPPQNFMTPHHFMAPQNYIGPQTYIPPQNFVPQNFIPPQNSMNIQNSLPPQNFIPPQNPMPQQNPMGPQNFTFVQNLIPNQNNQASPAIVPSQSSPPGNSVAPSPGIFPSFGVFSTSPPVNPATSAKYSGKAQSISSENSSTHGSNQARLDSAQTSENSSINRSHTIKDPVPSQSTSSKNPLKQSAGMLKLDERVAKKAKIEKSKIVLELDSSDEDLDYSSEYSNKKRPENFATDEFGFPVDEDIFGYSSGDEVEIIPDFPGQRFHLEDAHPTKRRDVFKDMITDSMERRDEIARKEEIETMKKKLAAELTSDYQMRLTALLSQFNKAPLQEKWRLTKEFSSYEKIILPKHHKKQKKMNLLSLSTASFW